jgi:hypothetical protein
VDVLTAGGALSRRVCAVLAVRIVRDKVRVDRTAAAADIRALRIFARLCSGADPAGVFER